MTTNLIHSLTAIIIGFDPIIYEVTEEVEYVTLTIIANASVPNDTVLMLKETGGTATSMKSL